MSKHTFSKKRCHFGFGQFPLKPLFGECFLVYIVLGQKNVLAKTDSVHENARFFSLPNINSVRQFLKNPFFCFLTFLDDHFKKHYFYRVFGLIYFSFFCVYFSNIKKEKTKNTIFFSKTSFLTSPKFCKKTLFWHNVTLFVFSKIPPKHYTNGENSETKKTWTSF